jgi:hypothetical protein
MGPHPPVLIDGHAMECAGQTSGISPNESEMPLLENCQLAVHSTYGGVRSSDRQSVGWRPEFGAVSQSFQ